MADTDQLLTPREAADLLRLKVDTLRNWRTRKTGPPFVRAGGRIRYRRNEVIAWLNNKNRNR